MFHEKTIYLEDAPTIKIWVPYSWNDLFHKIVELANFRTRNYRYTDMDIGSGAPRDIQLTMPNLFVDDINNIFMLFA
jgi:hypothetical protein